MNSSCVSVTKYKTEFVIPPDHLVIKPKWPKNTKPLTEKLINGDHVSYTQALESELDIQDKNYVEFHLWRDKMLKKKAEVQAKEK